MIGNTRSNIGAEIDTHYEILLQMIEDLAVRYHAEECAFNEKVYEEASKCDYETYLDMTRGYDEIQVEYCCKTIEARKVLFCAIFSYFESMVYGIIKFYGIDREGKNKIKDLVNLLVGENDNRLIRSEQARKTICDYYRPLRNYFMHGELDSKSDLNNLAIFVEKEDALSRNRNKVIEITDNEFLRRVLALIHGFLCAIEESYVDRVREKYNRKKMQKWG